MIGGAAAGPAAAVKAKKSNPDNEVILYEKGDYISIGTCEIPYVLSGLIEDWNKIVFYNPDTFLEEKKVVAKIRHEVLNINRQKKYITIKNIVDGKIFNENYDRLILTTGSRTKIPPEFIPLPENVFGTKTINDVIGIQNYLKKNNVRNVAILGAGYIGLELMDFVRSIGAKLTIIEKAKNILNDFDEFFSNEIEEKIKSYDIQIIKSVENLRISKSDNKVKQIFIRGEAFETDLVLLATGFEPNVALAISGNLVTGNYGIKVDSKLRTSDDNIFAAGDCTHSIDFITNKIRWLPLATIAKKQGYIAGKNASGLNENIDKVIKNICFKLFDKYYATVGLSKNECIQNNFRIEEKLIKGSNRIHIIPGGEKHYIKIYSEKESGRILGACLSGGSDIIEKANLLSSAIRNRNTLDDLAKIDYCYSPLCSPFIESLTLFSKK